MSQADDEENKVGTEQERAVAKKERFRQRVWDEIELERRSRFPWTGFVGAVVAVGVVVAGLAARAGLTDRLDGLDHVLGDASTTHCDSHPDFDWCTGSPASGLVAEVEALRDRVTDLEDQVFVAEQAEVLDAALKRASEAGLTRVDCTAGMTGAGNWSGPSILVDRDGLWWFETETGPSDYDVEATSAVDAVSFGWSALAQNGMAARERTIEPCVRAVDEAVAVLAHVQGGEAK